MSIFNGFFGQAFQGLTNPKGNLGDWRHASRLFIDNRMQFAPHSKFLYHVGFFLTPAAQRFTGNLFKPYENVIGMLVKSSDLPGFSVNLETKNKYNRKKNIQTNIEYSPISMEFYDDNFGLVTALMEAYYRYYYADANSATDFPESYGTLTGDTLYKDNKSNSARFGLDNNIPIVPFFDKIEITQLQRRRYTTYRLIRPILSSWNHDSVDYTDSNTPMQNSITINYDTVTYERGGVETGSNGSPTTFGQEKYDKVPSPLSSLGGTPGGISSIIGGADDVLSGRAGGLLGRGIATANIVQTARNLTGRGILEEGIGLGTQALQRVASGGLSSLFGGGQANNIQIVFPSRLQNVEVAVPRELTPSQRAEERFAERQIEISNAPTEELQDRIENQQERLADLENSLQGWTKAREELGDPLGIRSNVIASLQRQVSQQRSSIAQLNSEVNRRQTPQAPASNFDQTNPRGF